jgi:hypothetical protein
MDESPLYASFEDAIQQSAKTGKLPEAFRVPQSSCWDAFRAVSTEVAAKTVSGRKNTVLCDFFEGNELSIAGRGYYRFDVEEIRRYGALVREPGNPYDRDALRVYAVAKDSTKQEMLYRAVGYVSADTARRVSPVLDKLNCLAVRVKFDTYVSSFCAQFDDPFED